MGRYRNRFNREFHSSRVIVIINNFFTEAQCDFFSKYCDHATNNDSLEVNLVVGKKNEKVDRNYYTLRSHYKFMDEVREVAIKNWEQEVYFQKNKVYGHIMHYHSPGQGLKWHAEPNIATVSVSINLSNDDDYEGADFQIKGSNFELPKGAAIFYDSSLVHRVTPLTTGQKKSLVMWLPNNKQRNKQGNK